MANIVTYPYSTQSSDAADYLATALTALGCFDSVTASSGVVTCTIDGTTVATITLDASGHINVVFGDYTSTANSQMNYWIGVTPNGVFFDGQSSSDSSKDLFEYAIYKSKEGNPMFTYHGTWGDRIGFVHVALDTVSPSAVSNATMISSSYYSAASAVCAAPGTDVQVSVGNKVYHLTTKQSNIPTNMVSLVSIGGVEYMTDGYLLIETQ